MTFSHATRSTRTLTAATLSVLCVLATASGPLVHAGAVQPAASGALDPSFGTGGKVVTTIPSSGDGIQGLADTPDGKLLAVGYTGNRFLVVRYKADGKPDTTFGGGDGIVRTPFDNPAGAKQVAVLGNGDFLVAGVAAGGTTGTDFALARYHANGALDTSFGGGDGKVTTDFKGGSDQVFGLAVQRSGKVILGGYARLTSGHFAFAAARYLPGGTLDTTFGGGDGWATKDLGSGGFAEAVAVDPQDRIVVGGQSTVVGSDFALVRFKRDGGLDYSFGGDGVVNSDFGGTSDIADALAVRSDGGVLAAGAASVGANNQFALALYRPDGTPAASFGGGDGLVTTDIGPDFDRAFGVAVQPDGRIVAAGRNDPASGSNDRFAVIRYSPGGVLDSSFSGDGIATTNFTPSDDEADAVVVQPSGRVVAGGNAGNDAALAGYLGKSGPSCTWFGTGGSETVTGTGRPDVLCGRGGTDTLRGNAGRDTVLGGPGPDDLFGGKSGDTLLGGKGNDDLDGGPGHDRCVQSGGTGTKTSCEA
jgi:uncharacterized delta-60 repeat protein